MASCVQFLAGLFLCCLAATSAFRHDMVEAVNSMKSMKEIENVRDLQSMSIRKLVRHAEDVGVNEDAIEKALDVRSALIELIRDADNEVAQASNVNVTKS